MKMRHFALLLAAATVSFFAWRLGAPNAYLYRPGSGVSDLTVTFWPNIAFIQQSLRNYHELPLWRTLIFSGAPFDADPQSGLWYIPNLLFLVLPAAAGFNIAFVLHTVAAGLGMWIWARATGTTSGGALVAALAFSFTPRSFAHLGFGHVGLFYAAAYVPWALWAALRIGQGSWRHAAALGLALGWQLIAHPQLAFYTAAAAGGYLAVVTWASSPARARSRTWKRAIYGGLLGGWLTLAVAAAQVLPALRLAPLTARAAMGFSEAAVSSLPPRYLWGMLLADHRGFMDYMVYAGLPVLAFAVLALPRRRAVGWWMFVLVAIVYALGTHAPLYSLVLRLMPAQAWLRAPARVWFLAAAALALLAGWGVDRLQGGLDGRGRWALNLAAVGLGTFALALPLGYWIVTGPPPPNLVALGIVAPATAALCILMAARRLPLWGGIALAATLVLADLWLVDATLVEGRGAESVFADDALGTYLSRFTGAEPFRIYSPSNSLPQHTGARYDLETADGVDPLYLADYDAFMELASGVKRHGYGVTVPALEGGAEVSVANQAAVPNPALLGLLNVRFVASEFAMSPAGLREVARFGATHLYQNEFFLPRAFVVGNVDVVSGFDEALAWAQVHDAGHRAAVAGGQQLASGDLQAAVAWEHRSPNRLALDVTVDKRGFLVLSQVWYPGWRATVDGRQETLWRADAVLSGLYLEPGRHSVVLAYRPPLLWFGLGASLGGLLICLALALSGWTSSPSA